MPKTAEDRITEEEFDAVEHCAGRTTLGVADFPELLPERVWAEDQARLARSIVKKARALESDLAAAMAALEEAGGPAVDWKPLHGVEAALALADSITPDKPRNKAQQAAKELAGLYRYATRRAETAESTLERVRALPGEWRERGTTADGQFINGVLYGAADDLEAALGEPETGTEGE